jgi:uncharacterized protein (DUF58 family)
VRQRAFRGAPADRSPVVLRHSRIYILPTRRGYAVIATLVTMLLTSLNYALALGLGVTFLLGGLVAAALLHTFRNLAGIEIKPPGRERCVRRRPHRVLARRVERRDRSSRDHGHRQQRQCEGRDQRGVDADGDARSAGAGARPRTAWTRDAVVAASARAVARLGVRAFPADRRRLIQPEAHPPPLPSGAQGIDPHATGRGDDADLAGLREYQRGDPLQRVAWKAVARGAGWFSKSFEGTGGGGPITLDWSRMPAHLDAELRLSRLCAWVLAAERTTRPSGLALPGEALPTGSGEHRGRR